MNTTQYHNPMNVPADKVPKGWRFLTVEERKTRNNEIPLTRSDARMWNGAEFVMEARFHGNALGATYIIPDTQPEPAPSPWISTNDRLPTEADADKFGFLLAGEADGSSAVRHFSNLLGAPFWLPASAIPPLPVERKKSQEEKDNEAAVDYAVGRALTGCFQEARIAFLAGLRHERAQGKEQP